MRKILLALVMAMGTQGVAAEDAAKPAEWLFVHTAQSAEMTSATTLVMPVTRDIFAFTDRPNRMHGYMNAHEFVSLWDEGEGDTFNADPPNAVLTWVDSDEMKEAELLILSAEIVKHGREIAYEVKLEAGDTPADKLLGGSLFVDDGGTSANIVACFFEPLIAGLNPSYTERC
ncbi:hypothetical protein OAQ28_08060 [Planktomarina temperata]|nr:hypothetical protein [Planktomarina temperata]